MRALLVVVLVAAAACGFPEPALHGDGGMPPDEGGSEPPEPCPDGACQLLAIEPSIANTGDTIMLEGTFAAHATVHFPGGASVSATVLGPHRASVVVPAAATAGELTVTSGGADTSPLEFRRATFPLGLQRFQSFDDQSNGARATPSLVTGRNAADQTVVIARGFVYVVGGNNPSNLPLATVERAQVNGDGSLGGFAVLPTVLTRPRQSAAAVVVGDFLYVLGGDATGTIERAVIDASGSLGAFAQVGMLAQPRNSFSVKLIGNSLYAIGGNHGSADLRSVERAAIDADGSLGPFAVESTALIAPRVNAYGIVIGSYLYLIGGAAASAATSVEAAAIQPDGSLGAFAAAANLTTARMSAPVFVVGKLVYVVGGVGQTSVEAAAVRADGTLGSFAVIAGVSLPIAQAGGSCVAGGYAYLIDGTDATAGHTARVQRASLDAGGALGEFAAAPPSTLVVARADQAGAIVGNSVYLLGGANAAGRLDRIEQARIDEDGALHPFTASSVSLPVPVLGAIAAVVGNAIYVIGGSPDLVFTNAVSRTAVDASGTLQPFTAGPSLITLRANPGVAIAGSFLYVLGGRNANGALATVERSPIAPDRTLGAFATLTGVTLVTARFSPCVVIARSSLYVIGGNDGTSALATLERATVGADGTIGAFSTVPGVALATARSGHACEVIGDWLYVLGGSGAAPLASIERAQINDDGTLGAFSTVPAVSLAAPLSDYTSIVAGGFAYAIGGSSPAGAVATVSRSTLR